MTFEKHLKNKIQNLDNKIPKCIDTNVEKLLKQKRIDYKRLLGGFKY